MNTSIHSPSSSGPSSHVAMQMLHTIVMLHAAVLLPLASPMDKWHRAVRLDDRGRSCSAATLQIALADQRQLSAATCSRGCALSDAVDGELILVHAS